MSVNIVTHCIILCITCNGYALYGTLCTVKGTYVSYICIIWPIIRLALLGKERDSSLLLNAC